MAKIQLEINGEKKVFTAEPKKARIVREAAEIYEDSSSESLKVSDLDRIAEFISKVFDNQFTPDEYFDSIPSEQFMTKFYEIVGMLMGRISDKFPNA